MAGGGGGVPCALAGKYQHVDATAHPALAPLDVKGPFHRTDLDQVRKLVAAHFSPGLPQTVVHRLQTVISELVTNVIVHCGGEGRLRVTLHGSRIYCQVVDNGPGIKRAYLAGWAPPTAADPRSYRGLWLARMFSDQMTIDSSTLGTTITARIDIHHTAAST